ncbi:MAG: SDR family NAD(P)-dependent oxidoreductase [Dehalococcoidia bacterium]|nr:SDR family NAD(P)-dependent oxidoreductase [Dehalococcoidia bacterium]
MRELRGRVCVITGAASGIGLALAERAAAEGMRVVLSDIEAGPLEAAVAGLRGQGATAIGVRADVSKEAEVEELAARAYAEFGAVHLFCNNAGVFSREKPTWEHTPADWQWIFGVNVMGVVHGMRAFVPRMLASGEPGHVVNTASMAGLATGGMGTAVYDASKHAVVSLTESLYKDLVTRQSLVSASVLCPGVVDTNIFTAERNRPAEYGGGPGQDVASPSSAELPSDWLSPQEVAAQVFDGVREDRFYILASQPVVFEWVRMAHNRMWEGKNPAVPRRKGVEA